MCTFRCANRGQGGKESAKKIFGVLICSAEEEYNRTDYQNPSEQILAGVTECAHLNGVDIEVHLIDPKACTLDNPAFLHIEKLCSRWDGLLLVYPFPNPVLDHLAPKVPLVSLVEQFDHTGIDCVDVDHYKGISSAIEHLVELGHRRIGFFTRRYEVEASWSFRRYAAFMEAMVRLRLPVALEDIVNIFPSREGDDESSIEYAAERTRDGVTAWVCAADHQAYELVARPRETRHQCAQAGLSHGLRRHRNSAGLAGIEHHRHSVPGNRNDRAPSG